MTLEVETDALRSHAGEVAELAGQLHEAVSAGTTTALATDAFGLICAFLVPHTQDAQLKGVAALSAAADTMEGLSSGLRSTAAGYDAVDEHVAARLADLLTELTA